MPDRDAARQVPVAPKSGDRTRLASRVALYVAALAALTAVFAFGALRVW